MPCILALGCVLIVFLFDCFVTVLNSGNVEDPSVSAGKVLEETHIDSIQISR